MKFFKASWPFLLVFCCFGCSPRKRKKDVVYHESVSSCEARLTDIPFPLNSVPSDVGLCDSYGDETKTQQDAAQMAVSFVTTLSRDKLGEFYHQEMERFGWKELCIIHAIDESLLLYEKPFRLCTISLRINQKQRRACSVVRVFVSAK